MTSDDLDARRERSRVWYQQRRARGVCHNVHCSNEPEINPKTGEPYWSCQPCRRLTYQRRRRRRADA
jgi:hypothetical protein